MSRRDLGGIGRKSCQITLILIFLESFSKSIVRWCQGVFLQTNPISLPSSMLNSRVCQSWNMHALELPFSISTSLSQTRSTAIVTCFNAITSATGAKVQSLQSSQYTHNRSVMRSSLIPSHYFQSSCGIDAKMILTAIHVEKRQWMIR